MKKLLSEKTTKKLILTVLIIGGGIAFLNPTNVFAGEDYPWFEEPDFCAFHTNHACQEEVTKCRYVGGDYCIIFEQIPCEEVCPNSYPS